MFTTAFQLAPRRAKNYIPRMRSELLGNVTETEVRGHVIKTSHQEQVLAVLGAHCEDVAARLQRAMHCQCSWCSVAIGSKTNINRVRFDNCGIDDGEMAELLQAFVQFKDFKIQRSQEAKKQIKTTDTHL